jgi:hypothetical protein
MKSEEHQTTKEIVAHATEEVLENMLCAGICLRITLISVSHPRVGFRCAPSCAKKV